MYVNAEQVQEWGSAVLPSSIDIYNRGACLKKMTLMYQVVFTELKTLRVQHFQGGGEEMRFKMYLDI